MPLPSLAKAVQLLNEPMLSTFGLGIADATDTVVTLAGDRRAVRLSYNREDLPHAWLLVTVGASEVAGELPQLVALWRAYPDRGELQDPGLMDFSSQEELDRRLAHVRDDWFPRFILPLLKSEYRLRTALLEQGRELLLEHDRLIQERHVKRARSLFDGGDYQGAVDSYILAGIETLSAADARRLAIARRHLDTGRAP